MSGVETSRTWNETQRGALERMDALGHRPNGDQDRAYHLSETTRGHDVSGVDETVQVSCRLLYCLSHIIVAIEVEDICDEI